MEQVSGVFQPRYWVAPEINLKWKETNDYIFSANNHLISFRQRLAFYLSFFLPTLLSFVVSTSAFLVLKHSFFPHSPLSHRPTTKMQDSGECEEVLEFRMQRVNTVTARKTHREEQTLHLPCPNRPCHNRPLTIHCLPSPLTVSLVQESAPHTSAT